MDGWFSFTLPSGESFNSYAKAVLGNKSVDMSGKYGTSNAGAESVGVSDCNKVYKEAGNEAVMSISVDDCIDLDGKERSILAKVKDLSVISELLKHMSSEGFDDVCNTPKIGSQRKYVMGRYFIIQQHKRHEFKAFIRDVFGVQRCFSRLYSCLKMCLDRPGGSAIGILGLVVYLMLGGRWGSEGALRFVSLHIARTNIESLEVNSSLILERGCKGSSLDESLKTEVHLDVDSLGFGEEDVRRVEVILWTPFVEARFVIFRSCINGWVFKVLHGKRIGDDAV
ncbi:hypothetical protein Tco_0713944 [Tanacetum coccineum]